ncbi:collagen-binding domain-containing protein, partial [Corynebacterium flavescens]
MKKRMSKLFGSKGVKGIFGAGMAMALFLGSVPTVSAEETTPDTNNTCEATSTINPMGQATPIGSKDGYTIFVKDHAILANSELEGTIAVGGKATFGDSRGNQNQQYPIFHGGVGGNADYNVPTIDGVPNRVLIQEFESTSKVVQIKDSGATGDNLKAGGKIADQTKPTGYTFGSQFSGSGSTYYPAGGDNQSPQIDSVTQPFTNVEAAQKSWGIDNTNVMSYFPEDQGGILSTYDDWATIKPPAGDDQTVILNGKQPSKLSVSDFKGYSKFKLEGYSENSFLVIKATPADVKDGVLTLPSYSFPGKDEAQKEGISHILFDLSEINGDVKITAPNEPIRGSIYAPSANVTIPPESEGGREFEGQIIAQNFTALQGGKEMHTNIFHGRFPGSEGGDCGGFSLEKKLVGVEAADVPADAVFRITAKWTI